MNAGNPPEKLQDCATMVDLVGRLQREADEGGCEDIKTVKQALANDEPVGTLPPEAVASGLLTLVEEGGDHPLRLECADGLATAATDNPPVIVDFCWEIQDIIMDVDDPALFERLKTAAVDVTIAGSPEAARSVANTLTGVLETQEIHDQTYVGMEKRRTAIEGLRTLAESSNATIQGHVARTLVDYLDQGLVG